jgi:hypothetical protein
MGRTFFLAPILLAIYKWESAISKGFCNFHCCHGSFCRLVMI